MFFCFSVWCVSASRFPDFAGFLVFLDRRLDDKRSVELEPLLEPELLVFLEERLEDLPLLLDLDLLLLEPDLLSNPNCFRR